MDDRLEILWDALLSRQAETIRLAFAQLSQADQATVLRHLCQMVTEPGWQIDQRLSAQAALDALGIPSD